MIATSWSPDSWRSKPQGQPIIYEDEAAVLAVVKELRARPPVVAVAEIDALKARLAEAHEGRSFIVQAGDCAERFEDCTAEAVKQKLDVIDALAGALAQAGLSVIRVGRIAGQYAKPRSSLLEVRGEVSLASYFGDLYNDAAFSAPARRLDPKRLLRGYELAATTLKLLSALTDSGRSLEEPGAEEPAPPGRCFTSHEGLNLYYESSLTRADPRSGRYYNLSAHLPWIGDRTRLVGGAHVELFRGVENPVAVKLGPTASPEEVVELTRILNPKNQPGKLVLVPRLGAERIKAQLPPLIHAVLHAERRALWICDPMHGNTRTLKSGHKTRDFEAIAGELEASFRVHAAMGSALSGVHLEVSGDDVVECTGGPSRVVDRDIGHRYASLCDPRLNFEQAVAIAELAAALASKSAEAHRAPAAQ